SCRCCLGTAPGGGRPPPWSGTRAARRTPATQQEPSVKRGGVYYIIDRPAAAGKAGGGIFTHLGVTKAFVTPRGRVSGGDEGRGHQGRRALPAGNGGRRRWPTPAGGGRAWPTFHSAGAQVFQLEHLGRGVCGRQPLRRSPAACAGQHLLDRVHG